MNARDISERKAAARGAARQPGAVPLPRAARLRVRARVRRRSARSPTLSPAVGRFVGCDAGGRLVGTEPVRACSTRTTTTASCRASPALPRAAAARASFLVRLRRHDGEYRCLEVVATNLLDNPSVARRRRERPRRHRPVRGRGRAARERGAVPQRVRVRARSAWRSPTRRAGIVRCNEALAHMLGRSPAELTGRTIRDITHPDDWDDNDDKIHRLFAGELRRLQLEKRYLHADGHAIWVSVSVSGVRDADGVTRYMIGQIEDITERKAIGERLVHQAIHDPLTGLPNRLLLHRPPAATSWPRSAAPPPGRGPLRGPRPLQGDQRQPRTRGRRPAAPRRRAPPATHAAPHRHGGALRRRRVHDPVPRRRRPRPRSRASRSGCSRRSPGRCGSSTARCSPRRASASPARCSAPTRPSRPRRWSATPTPPCTGRRSSADAGWSSSTSGCAPGPSSTLHIGNDLHRALERGEFELHYQPILELEMGRVERVRGPRPLAITPSGASSARSSSSAWPRRPASSSRSARGCSRRRARSSRRGRPRSPTTEHPLTVSANVSPRQLAEPSFPDQIRAVIQQSGIRPGHAVARDHRDGPHARHRVGDAARCGRCAASACTSRSTTSGPATRR